MTALDPDKIKTLRDVGISRILEMPPTSDATKRRAGVERIANDVIAKL